MSLRVGVCLFVLLLTGRVVVAQPADPLPTEADIKQTFDAGDYPKTLQKLQRVLLLKGKAAEPYNRHSLLRLRAQTHLYLKNSSAAIASYAEASKEAPDGPTAALDIASELVVRRANAGLQFQPKRKDPDDKTKSLLPIDVVDPASRKKAIDSLFLDEWAAVEPRVQQVKAQRTLPPILEAMPAIRNVRWLELASTGSDGRSKSLVADLVDRSKTLLDTALKDMAETLDRIEPLAMEVITARVPINDQRTGKILGFEQKWKRRGPTKPQFTTIRDTFQTATKIRDTCDELGGTLGSSGKEFDAVKAQADGVRQRAGVLLETNWDLKYDQPPAAPERK